MDLLQNILDTSAHAIFTVDSSGIVTHINRQAKERFGLFNHSGDSHAAGRLCRGDLVILATSAIGVDDGTLQVKDLAALGIRDKKLRPGDRLLAVGSFQNPQVKPVYKYLHTEENENLFLQTVFQGIPIMVKIADGVAQVEVWGTAYSLQFFRSIGQMVVVDRRAGCVKFWEENGYSARKEGIGDLLRGATYIAKSPDTQLDVVGYHFRDFFEGSRFEEHLRQVMDGIVPAYVDQEYRINGFDLTANLLPITGDSHTIDGVIVKFRNIADIRATIMERNAAIRSAERQYKSAEKDSFLADNAFSSLFGTSTAMSAAKRYAYKLSQTDCPILITGEYGTGKTELAQAILSAQPRQGAFFSVDCTALTQENWENELLGSHTANGEPGIFQKAHGGTILLDEISAVPLNIQNKLLQIIDNKTIFPSGRYASYPADVRLLATSRRDLKALADQGSFRSDLYYRLSAFSVSLPPLRQCREDIPFLINNLMDSIRQKYDFPEKYLSGEAFNMLLSYDWPGNIRELETVLERAVTLSDGDIIYPEHIRLEVAPTMPPLRQQLREMERRILAQALQMTGGNKKQAWEMLGLSRTVFYDKLKEYGLHEIRHS